MIEVKGKRPRAPDDPELIEKKQKTMSILEKEVKKSMNMEMKIKTAAMKNRLSLNFRRGLVYRPCSAKFFDYPKSFLLVDLNVY